MHADQHKLQSLTFDAKGRTKSITTSGIGAVTQCTYDPYDYPIYKYYSHGNQTNLLEGEHLEGTMSGLNWQAKFMRGAVIDEIVNGFEYNTSGVWTNYTFHHDNLQSVLGLSGHEGSVLQTISYGPFGEVTGTTGAANNNYLHFTGREIDPDSGLYYFRARFYDPTIGRFITEDPKGFDAGVNFYAFVQNNPINANDPYGFVPPQYDINGLSTGKANSLLSCHFNEHYDYRENFIGGMALIGLATAGFAPELLAVGSKVSNYIQSSLPYTTAMVAAGTKTGQNILNEAPAFIDSWMPAESPPALTAGGLTGYLTKSLFDAATSNSSGSAGYQINKQFQPFSNDVSAGSGKSNIPSINVEVIGFDMPGDFSSSAAGGFVIYPNKANLNMMKSVYAK